MKGTEKVPRASLNCLAHGCEASNNDKPCFTCLVNGCLAADYVKPETVEVRDSQAGEGKLGDGFPDMAGDLRNKKPTENTDGD